MENAIFAVGTEQFRALDRITVEEFGLDRLQMLENAGRQIAVLAAAGAGPRPPAAHRVMVLAGIGGNGASGLAAARHLANWGTRTLCYLVGNPERASAEVQQQRRILKASGVPVVPLKDETLLVGELSVTDLVIDALLGSGIEGNPRDLQAGVIRAINASMRPVLSVDLPSGLHPDSGEPLSPCVRARTTVALGLPKLGLMTPEGWEMAGEIHVIDLGIPPAAVARVAGRPHRFPGPYPVRLAGPTSVSGKR